MKIGIISSNRRLYTTRRIWEVCRKAGHDVRFLHPKKCAVGWTAEGAFLRTGGLSIDGLDAVIPRIGNSLTETGLVVLRHFEERGVPTPNTAAAISLTRDKVACLQFLASRRFPVPPTISMDSPEQIDDCVDQLGGFPLVVKVVRGTQGVGVIKVGARDQLQATMETLWHLGEQLILQRFVEECAGSDLRLLVVDGRVAAAMERTAAPGDFRSNIHRGGTGRGFKPSDELSELAVSATAAAGLGIAGVDILLTNKGPAILELNSSPGLEGIESATGKDLARIFVRYVESLSTS